jgi:translation initiation factor IF-1
MPRPAAEAAVGSARVIELLPNALVRVELQNAARTQLTAHVSSASSLLRVLPGDVVEVEISAYDRTRGRIVGKRA